MKINLKHSLSTLALSLIIGLTVSSVHAEWTGPTYDYPDGNDPDENVAAPLNVSAEGQTKTGWLWIEGLNTANPGVPLLRSLTIQNGQVWIANGTTTSATTSLSLAINGKVGASNFCDQYGKNCSTAQQIASSTATVASSSIWTLANSIIYNTSTTTRVAIGTTTSATNLKLKVNGKVGASEYCDQNGMNCSAPSRTSNVFYLTQTPLYQKTTTFQGGYAKIVTFTESELRANIPEMATEPRDILGILVSYTLYLNENANADNKGYNLYVEPNISGSETYSNSFARKEYFFWQSGANASLFGQMPIIDYPSVWTDDQFGIYLNLFLATVGSVNTSITGTLYVRVYGYITR